MRLLILVFFCITGFTASAQFWKKKPKPQPVPLLVQSKIKTVITIGTISYPRSIQSQQLPQSAYSLEVAEDAILKEAKHNMRFRIYNVASYNFSDLAALYIQQNRFSEAKWYLLQSNTISRQEDDTKHTLANLLALATIKIQIGEIALAKTDLQEAHDIAAAKGMQTELVEIDKRLLFLQTNKIVAAKSEMRYAEAVEAANSKTVIN